MTDASEARDARASDLVAQRITELRRLRRWSAKALAGQCAEAGAPEITAAVIANIETGRRGPDGIRRRDVTVDELLAFAAALGVKPGDLLGPWGGREPGLFAAELLAAFERPEVRAALRSLIVGMLSESGTDGEPGQT